MGGDVADVLAAERVQRRRARLFPVLGILLIVANAAFLHARPVSVAGSAAWLGVFIGGAMLVGTGGLWPGRLRLIAEDEASRAHRRQAVAVGYAAAMCCAAGLYVASVFVALTAHEALQILLATAVGAPLIGFGAMERHALGDA